MPSGIEITEGRTKLLVPESHSLHGPGTRTASVFFNEQMAFGRDISIMFLRALDKGQISVVDAMSATGARAVRIANEVAGTSVTANDIDPKAIPYIEHNISLNGLSNCVPSNKDLHILFAESSFDYVDIDPFGSPTPFIQSAIRGCRKKGILAITATDTAPLAGAQVGKCRRRYQSEPIRGYMCHESGLRILMCNIAKELAKFDRGMKPLLSFYADHYFRVYVQVEEGAAPTDRSLDQIGYLHYDPNTLGRSVSKHPDATFDKGPFWIGLLHDKALLARMNTEGAEKEKRCIKMLDLWRNELDEQVFLYDISELSSFTKLSPPKIEALIDALNESGRTTPTHMSPTSFKTELVPKDVISIYKENSPDSIRQ
ncbi:tRNA (guanine(26)-N(2))-dimethyltransferase [Candidatus Methanoplasma termitum]|uniref:tRNA (guanine(26)-N(2))-dimethyltransferase n=1 Tax=Candidatus Methanoplasma termitum TaxID=1577791 RepID=A0A0A7LC19_9ARCH|nr:tRNA (guanine(26)-N(2))-dimethyltransferase [Candidatus Methanoplasma termitum]AIZ56579.1 tRNA (guanine(26)-N(2))-dimethyltransferase [Candidatus Methanoplasma termitum]MCL2333826.1 tRNA (guanine(26)-N(2))-dimethyltransferase [Candidatus Methanoplasma sp.]